MTPKLKGFDHAHLNVGSKKKAEQWYGEVLGFKRVTALDAWDVENGPLTLEDEAGNIHLAIFQKDGPASESSMAYGADGVAFLEWKAHLESKGLTLRVADHELAYSLYFSDPWENLHEITTYDRDYVADHLG
jgi:catechol-2,3-dioxygenase